MRRILCLSGLPQNCKRVPFSIGKAIFFTGITVILASPFNFIKFYTYNNLWYFDRPCNVCCGDISSDLTTKIAYLNETTLIIYLFRVLISESIPFDMLSKIHPVVFH